MINIIALIASLYSTDYLKSFDVFYSNINACVVSYSRDCTKNFRIENLDFFKSNIAPQAYAELSKTPIGIFKYYDALYKRDVLVGLINLKNKNYDGAKNSLSSSLDLIKASTIRPYHPNMRLAKELHELAKKDSKLNYKKEMKNFLTDSIEVCNLTKCKADLEATLKKLNNNSKVDFTPFLSY